MHNAFRNKLFITGVPMVIVGLGVCLNQLLWGRSVGYLAFAVLVSGCTLLLIGWVQRSK
jgi:hypothetical protein